MTLKLLPRFAENTVETHSPIWINPELVTHIEPRVDVRADSVAGTYIYFTSSDSVAQ
jgi:hypothetical protein